MKWNISWSITSPTGTVLGEARVSGAKIMDAINKFLCKKGNEEKRIIGIEMVDEKPKKKRTRRDDGVDYKMVSGFR